MEVELAMKSVKITSHVTDTHNSHTTNCPLWTTRSLVTKAELAVFWYSEHLVKGKISSLSEMSVDRLHVLTLINVENKWLIMVK